MNFTTAWLTTNRNCNNRCKWCYAQNTLDSLSIMDFDKTKQLVNILKNKNVKHIILIGGEPTLYPYVFDLLRYIREKNISVSMASNGRRFSDLSFSKQIVESGINGIDISLKGITEEEYLSNTGTYGLKETLQGYFNLKKLNFNPSMSYVLVNDNFSHFDKVISFIEKNNISPVSFQFAKPVLTLGIQNKPFDLKKMGKFVEKMYNRLSNTNINYFIEISFPLCLINKCILEKLTKENRILNCCHVPKGNGINFDENFKVIPCNHFAEFPFSEIPINPSDEDCIDKVINSEIVKNFRKFTRYYPSSKCQDCNLWEQCGGGCFVNWLTLDPNDYIL